MENSSSRSLAAWVWAPRTDHSTAGRYDHQAVEGAADYAKSMESMSEKWLGHQREMLSIRREILGIAKRREPRRPRAPRPQRRTPPFRRQQCDGDELYSSNPYGLGPKNNVVTCRPQLPGADGAARTPATTGDRSGTGCRARSSKRRTTKRPPKTATRPTCWRTFERRVPAFGHRSRSSRSATTNAAASMRRLQLKTNSGRPLVREVRAS